MKRFADSFGVLAILFCGNAFGGSRIDCFISLAQQYIPKRPEIYNVNHAQTFLSFKYDYSIEGPKKILLSRKELFKDNNGVPYYTLITASSSSDSIATISLQRFTSQELGNSVAISIVSNMGASDSIGMSDEASAYAQSMMIDLDGKLLGLAQVSCIRK